MDGVDEFLDACADRSAAAPASRRTYLPEFAEYEINSPGEPGVLYHMGIGFTTTDVALRQGHHQELREQSAQRNLGLIERANAYLDPVKADYATDVLPLTPAGNATERHIVTAYIGVAERVYPDAGDRAAFWSSRLDLPLDKTESLMQNLPAFQNQIRSRLMKKGGVGYVQPGHDTFPPVDKLHDLILACGALPCAAWLDGTTSGEERMDDLFDLLVGKGAVALNIVPDRNWDIPDPAARKVKSKALRSRRLAPLDLPLNVGTEMNSYGQSWSTTTPKRYSRCARTSSTAPTSSTDIRPCSAAWAWASRARAKDQLPAASATASTRASAAPCRPARPCWKRSRPNTRRKTSCRGWRTGRPARFTSPF